MKGNVFTIAFFIIFIVMTEVSDSETKELTQTRMTKEGIEDAYMSAVDSAVNQLKSSYEHDERLNKEAAAEVFFLSLHAGLGIMDDQYLKERFNLYVPVIAVVVNEGFYVLYNAEVYDMGVLDIKRTWSELIPFSYEDEFFIYRFTLGEEMMVYDKKGILGGFSSVVLLTQEELREQFIMNVSEEHVIRDKEQYQLFKNKVIISKIEKCLAYYVNRNNYIAKSQGITYSFYFPEIDQSEWIRSVSQVSMIVSFQGYPYNNGRDVYNQFIVSGASIKRSQRYYIVPRDYYYIYHVSGCILLNEAEIRKTAYSLIECAGEGAYPCSECN